MGVNRLPFYCFVCDSCGKKLTALRTMKHRNDVASCECGESMHRDLPAEAPHAQSRGRDYSKPIHSNSLAISPSQVAEHKRLFPNVKLDSECRPVFDNYTDHNKYLEKTGFVKMPTKRKRRFTKK